VYGDGTKKHGDGGGGTTRLMIEYAKRLEMGIPGSPTVKIDGPVEYMKRLEREMTSYNRPVKWVGELYFENHRGTYTSIAKIKKFNRKAELLYQKLEGMASLWMLIDDKYQYPQQEINLGWKKILLNQFHDILPGSSVKEVYEDSTRDYNWAIDVANNYVRDLTKKLCNSINVNKNSIVVFNDTGMTSSDIVECDIFENNSVIDTNGMLVPTQITYDNKLMFAAKNIPSKGYSTFSFEDLSSDIINSLFVCKEFMENSFYKICFDDNMNITSIYDKENNREVIKSGERGNVLQAFEDIPYDCDAWNINVYYKEKMWEVNDVKSVEIIESGPVRGMIKITRGFCDSTIIQKICIYNDIRRIDFKTFVDWKENHIMLKTAFPVDVYSENATYDIQFGNVKRPTHRNTSWDFAKFEVCAHKWADLSDNGYGVSLMNDCKYGYDIYENIIRLTLLKSATSPNVDADRECHDFTYSLFPHIGDWRVGGTINAAYTLNCPMSAEYIDENMNGILLNYNSMFSINQDNVILETIKKSEDDNSIIIRLYESYNRKTIGSINAMTKIKQVFECDLMENEINPVSVNGSSFNIEINPYEIKTYKIISNKN